MRKLWFYSVFVLFLSLAGVRASIRATPMQFNLTQWTLAPRAVTSGENYVLWSIAGQPEAGRLSGGNYVLSGGFRVRAGPGPAPSGDYLTYLPLVVK